MSYEKHIENLTDIANEQIQVEVVRLQLKLNRIVKQLLLLLDTEDGLVLQQKNSIYTQIQRIFSEIELELKEAVIPILNESFDSINEVISQELSSKFGNIKHKSISKRIGLTSKNILRNTPLGQLFSLQLGADSLKNTLTIASSMKMDIRMLEKSITVIDSEFLIDKFKKSISDFILRHSRLSISETAQDNGLNYFIYTNSLISTSRPFCKEHAGKAFTIEETKNWVNSPLLNMPEKWKPSYIPLVHMGGFNCRHFPKYITESTYKALKLSQ